MRNVVLTVIYDSLDEVNADLEHPVEKKEDAPLFGPNSVLDSMGLVHLITAIEEKLEEKTGKYISIADERAMSLTSSPFRTVRTLADYVMELVNEQS